LDLKTRRGDRWSAALACLLLLALGEACSSSRLAASDAAEPASIALWTVPKQVRAGEEFWLQARVVPNATLREARLALEVPPHIKVLGPASLALGTLAPPEVPPPSKPPALPFVPVYAFRLLPVAPGAAQLAVVLTSGSQRQRAMLEVEVAR
jgi:hypothetical protein